MIDTAIGADPKRVRSLIRVLVKQTVNVRYRGSSLGVFWSTLNPIFMTCVYAFVFGRQFAVYYDGSKIRYISALLIGLAITNFFSSATFQALQSVVSNGLLLNKMRVPSIVFPTSAVLANCVQLAFGTLPILVIIAIAVGRNVLWTPFVLVLLFALICMSLGIGLALSAFFVYYRDIPNLWDLAYFGIFVATPVFYPLEIIDPRYRPFIEYTPLALIIEQLRAIAVRGVMPSFEAIGLALAYGIAILCIGLIVFRRASGGFMDFL